MIDIRCTFFPDGNWMECCVAHDYGCADAECQRSAEMRLAADQGLRRCVTKKGHPIIAWIMFLGVRIWANLKGGY